MILEALRRARTRKRIVFISLLLFGTGLLGAVGLTSAFFEGEFDTQTATFAGGYLAAPLVVGVLPNTSTSSGYDGVLTWTNSVEPVPTSVLTGTSNTANAPYTITSGTSSLTFAAGLKGYIKSGDAVFVHDATNSASATCTAGGTPAVGDITLTVSGCTSITNGTAFSTSGATTNVTDTSSNEVQRILGADQGTTTNNCAGAVYSTTVLNSTTSPTTTQAYTYSDSNRATSPSNINGDWYCYEVVHGFPSTTAPVWTSPIVSTVIGGTTTVDTTPVQIGLAPISVVVASGGMAGTVSTNDTIVITYNQPITMTSNTFGNVCQFQTEGVMLIGDTTGCSGSATVSDAYTLGKIIQTTTNGGEHKKSNATIAVGTGVNANKITVTVTQNGAAVTGAIHFVSSTNGGTVVSLATTDRATACTTGVNCNQTASGSF